MNTEPQSYRASGVMATTGRVVHTTAARTVSIATDKAAHNGFGVLASTATAAGDNVAVTELGDALVECGDTFTPGTHFWATFDGSGRAIPAGAAERVWGYFKGDRAAIVGQRALFFVLPRATL